MAYKPKQKDKKEIAEILNTISSKVEQLENIPNAEKHQLVSFVKSGVRILGYGFLLINLPIAVILLIFSEAIGIYEELV
jgi:hypothetical protein